MRSQPTWNKSLQAKPPQKCPFIYLTAEVLAPLPVWRRHRPVVEKPFRREAVLAVLENAIARPRKGANDNHWHGGLVVPWTRVHPPL